MSKITHSQLGNGTELDGFTMAHSEEVKARAMAALLTGQSVGNVAKRFRLPKQTVSRFKSGLVPFVLEQATEAQRERIGDLLLSCTEEHVQALTRIAQSTTTPEYLAGQNLRGVAARYREMRAFVVRLLEAAQQTGTLQRGREHHADREISLV